MNDSELLINIFAHYKEYKDCNVNAESTPTDDEVHYAATIKSRNIEDLGYQFFKTHDFVKYSVRFHFKDNDTLSKEGERELEDQFDKDKGPFQLLEVNEKWIELVGSVSKDGVDEDLLDEIDEYLNDSETINRIQKGQFRKEKVVSRMLKDLAEMVGDQADIELIMSKIAEIDDRYLDEIDESETLLNNLLIVTNYMLVNTQANKHYLSRLFEMNNQTLDEIFMILRSMNIVAIIDGDYELKEGEIVTKLRKLFYKNKNNEIKEIIRKELNE